MSGVEQEKDDQEIFAYAGRFNAILPEWIWRDLIPLPPQQRRAYLLRELLKVPLTFDLAFFEFELSFSTFVIILKIFREAWQALLKEYIGITIFIIVILVVLYSALKYIQIRNEPTILEEISFNALVSLTSFLLALWVAYIDFFSKYLTW